jgi:hypothetical protein
LWSGNCNWFPCLAKLAQHYLFICTTYLALFLPNIN